MTDFFGAYAADLPVAYKARVETLGQFRVWGEGGAIWSGGDRIIQDFNLGNFTSGELLLGLGLGTPGGGPGGSFDLTPKIGWEAATGFDYRFANSPYHVSGQFRYGRGGKTSGSAATSGTVDPAIIDLFNSGDDEDSIFSHIASAGGNERRLGQATEKPIGWPILRSAAMCSAAAPMPCRSKAAFAFPNSSAN